MNKLGYAEVRKTYKANENKITNRYYGENGEPVRLSNGQYGSIEYGYSIHYIGLDGSYVFNLQRELDNCCCDNWFVDMRFDALSKR